MLFFFSLCMCFYVGEIDRFMVLVSFDFVMCLLCLSRCRIVRLYWLSLIMLCVFLYGYWNVVFDDVGYYCDCVVGLYDVWEVLGCE